MEISRISQSKKKKWGQFFTKNASYICQDLLCIFPHNATVFDPFSGEGDLLKILPSHVERILGYDIDPKNNVTIQQDTLKHPVQLKDAWVITNPPYLYRTKNDDKTYYNQYNVDDLYKCAILSIMETNVLGGVLIVPLNFLSGMDNSIRIRFFSEYSILNCNIFHEQVFPDTTYTVCAFSFIKHCESNFTKFTINTCIYPDKKHLSLTLEKKYGFQIGGELRHDVKNSMVKISRLRKGDDIPQSKLFLRATDSSNTQEKISLTLSDEPFFGLDTDRTFATIVFDHFFTLKQQTRIAQCFNNKINQLREQYHGLFLTNYREGNRKRIGFNFAYELIGNCIVDLELVQKQISSYF